MRRGLAMIPSHSNPGVSPEKFMKIYVMSMQHGVKYAL